MSELVPIGNRMNVLIVISVKVATNPSCAGRNHSVFALNYTLEKRNVLYETEIRAISCGC